MLNLPNTALQGERLVYGEGICNPATAAWGCSSIGLRQSSVPLVCGRWYCKHTRALVGLGMTSHLFLYLSYLSLFTPSDTFFFPHKMIEKPTHDPSNSFLASQRLILGWNRYRYEGAERACMQ